MANDGPGSIRRIAGVEENGMSLLASELVGTFELLGSADVAGMRADVRRYSSSPSRDERIWTAPTNFLSYQHRPGVKVWGRQVVGVATDYMCEGPLTYRPRSAQWQTRTNGRPQTIVKAAFDTPMAGVAEFYAEYCSINDVFMIELMRLLHNELCSPGFGNTSMLESIAELLQIKLWRLAAAPGPASEAKPLTNVELGAIREYVEAKRGAPPSVSELSTLLNLSRRSLLRRFKATTSMTISQFIAEVQLTRAKQLLVGSDVILKQIAYETGFASPSQFAIAFKRATGATPRQYRDQARDRLTH